MIKLKHPRLHNIVLSVSSVRAAKHDQTCIAGHSDINLDNPHCVRHHEVAVL